MHITKEQKENEQVQRIMTGLKCSEWEARRIYEYDLRVEKGEKTEYDLSADKQKIAQKFAHAGKRKPTAFKFDKRTRKPNATKGGIIAELAEFLEKNSQFSVESTTITNAERQISFIVGGENFELTLVQKRKPKK